MHENIILSQNISIQIAEWVLLLVSIVPITRKTPAAPLAPPPSYKDPVMQTGYISLAALTEQHTAGV